MSNREWTLVQVLILCLFGALAYSWFRDPAAWAIWDIEFWNSEQGRHTACAYDFRRMQMQAVWGHDLGCSPLLVMRYYETGGFGFDPSAYAVCIDHGWKKEIEEREGIFIQCGGRL